MLGTKGWGHGVGQNRDKMGHIGMGGGVECKNVREEVKVELLGPSTDQCQLCFNYLQENPRNCERGFKYDSLRCAALEVIGQRCDSDLVFLRTPLHMSMILHFVKENKPETHPSAARFNALVLA